MSETAAELGGALGIALLGSFATFLYRNRMADAVPDNLEGAAGIRTSLAAAVDAAKSLPMEISEPMMATARAAFMTSYYMTALMAAAVLSFVALIAARGLRETKTAIH